MKRFPYICSVGCLALILASCGSDGNDNVKPKPIPKPPVVITPEPTPTPTPVPTPEPEPNPTPVPEPEPVPTVNCADGSVIPATQNCPIPVVIPEPTPEPTPIPTITCADGSIIPATSECPVIAPKPLGWNVVPLGSAEYFRTTKDCKAWYGGDIAANTLFKRIANAWGISSWPDNPVKPILVGYPTDAFSNVIPNAEAVYIYTDCLEGIAPVR